MLTGKTVEMRGSKMKLHAKIAASILAVPASLLGTTFVLAIVFSVFYMFAMGLGFSVPPSKFVAGSAFTLLSVYMFYGLMQFIWSER